MGRPKCRFDPMPSQTLLTLEAYERWAPTYAPVPHNPLMRAEQRAMLVRWPPVGGRHALDLACGTGRYTSLLTESRAASVTALDFSGAMLRRVSGGSHRVQGSMMSLPFVDGAFGVVVSGLAVGHAPDLKRCMAEISRVLEPRGALLYSDFHPEAARAGFPRSFKDEQGRKHIVPHNSYAVGAQRAAVAESGLHVESIDELRVGVEHSEPFPGSEDFYRDWHGLPFVLVVSARKQ
jgi:ubiquinone/menaquinone biosynthesis C-methylase UbiE